ncbi:MAG: RAMP superfamily CRISPR-associated protein [Chloroflexota bacterium]
MIALTYTIRLLEPLLATSAQGDPNSRVSYDYIPGSMIRGLIAKCCNTHGSVDQVFMEWTRPYLFDGSVRFLNAYLAYDENDVENERCLPVPLSWHKEKTKKGEILEVEDFALLDPEQSNFEKSTGVEAGFISQWSSNPTFKKASRSVSIHTRRDRHAGRATKTHGDVYRYEVLSAGQILTGAILVPNEEIGGQLQQWLTPHNVPTHHSIGGAQSAGYGLVEISNLIRVHSQSMLNQEGRGD